MEVLAVHRHEVLGAHDGEQGLDLLLLGVTGGVHVVDAGRIVASGSFALMSGKRLRGERKMARKKTNFAAPIAAPLPRTVREPLIGLARDQADS